MEDLSAIASIQSDNIPNVAEPGLIDYAMYRAMYETSIRDPEAFWAKEAKRLDWIKPYTRVKDTSFAYPDVSIKWFEDGTLNVSANCIDRHLKKRGKQVAIIWEPDDPSAEARHITYRDLSRDVNVFANVLKAQRVKRGDRATISADDPRGGFRHARPRAHRCHPLGGVRRVLAGRARRGRSWSLPPTKGCAAARRSSSSTTPTRR